MEGVGARLGRSSSRYGTTTVFSGPVRKWKKKWVHVTPSNNASSNNHIHSFANGTNNGSRLHLYEWTPISQSNKSSSSENKNNNNEDKNSGEDAAAAPTEELPMRIFNYIPIELTALSRRENA